MDATSDLTAREAEAGAAASRNGNLRERVQSLRLDGRGGGKARGNPFLTLFPWGVCLILLAATAAFAYRTYRVTPAGAAAPPATADGGAPAEGVPASFTPGAGGSASSGELALQAKGYIVPIHQILVSPKVGGILEYLDPKFEEGARFEEGQLIGRIEDVEFRADFDRATANLAAAEQRHQELGSFRDEEVEQSRAELAEVEANLKQLRLDLDRTVRLAGTSAAANKDYEIAQYGFSAMEAKKNRLQAGLKMMVEGPRKEKREAAKAEVAAAKADLAKAKWRLENCEIRAPITGTVLTKKAEKGNLVNPSAFSNGLAASLCEMADLSEIEVDLSIQERDIPGVFKGQRCLIMPEAFEKSPDFRKLHPQGYTGFVSRLMPIADRAKGAITVRVRVEVPKDEAGVYLKPDMGMNVVFLKKKDG